VKELLLFGDDCPSSQPFSSVKILRRRAFKKPLD
jgi:hypothetical protein